MVGIRGLLYVRLTEARQAVIYIGVLGLSVIAAVVALRMPRGDGAGRYLAISAVPLLLTVVVPLPLTLVVRGPIGPGQPSSLSRESVSR